MFNKPEQPDLFEWKPASGFFARLRQFLKSKHLLRIVFQILFALLFLIDNFFIFRFIINGKDFGLQEALPFFILTLIFLIIYAVKRPAVISEHFNSVYFWIIIFAVGFLTFLHYQDAAVGFLTFFREQWLLSAGLLAAVLFFLVIKKPPYFLKLLKSKSLRLIGIFYFLISLPFIQFYAFFPNPKYLMIPLGIALVAASLLAIWKIPLWQTRSLQFKEGGAEQSDFEREEKRLKIIDETRKTIATIIGGLFVIVGAVFTYSNYELSSEGQVTNRFSTAVVLLKDDDSSVRLGGLYALERIAKDSPKDHATIMDILAVYIRERSRPQREKIALNKSAVGNQNLNADVVAEKDTKNSVNASNNNVNSSQNNTTVSNQSAKEFEDSTAPLDILAAAEIIRRRDTKNDRKGSFFDLSNANLTGANLYETNLDEVNLSDAGLFRAVLSSSSLERANFTSADLRHARFYQSKLNGATFMEANLSFARFGDAELGSANFGLAILDEADFEYAELRRAFFKKARLKRTVFSSARIIESNFEEADLTNASFADAHLFKTSFESAILNGADFKNAEISQADFSNADLRNCTNLEFDQIKYSIINEETKLPDNLVSQRSELLRLSKEFSSAIPSKSNE